MKAINDFEEIAVRAAVDMPTGIGDEQVEDAFQADFILHGHSEETRSLARKPEVDRTALPRSRLFEQPGMNRIKTGPGAP